MRLNTVPLPARSGRARGVLRALYTPEQMQMILQRERARADRNEREFSVVIFSLAAGKRRSLHRMARLVRARSRTIDDVGWFTPEKVCTVLPETSSFGAACFARNVCEMAAGRALQVRCQLFTYPSKWFGDRYEQDDGHDEDAPLFVGSEDGRAPDAEDGVLPNRDMLESSASIGLEELLAQSGGVAPVTGLFVKRIPWWKRAMDVAGAALGLLVLSPIMLIVAGLIKLSSRGPVLFRQERAGIGGRPFTIYKFRTMVVGAHEQQVQLRRHNEQDGPAFKIRNDPRVTGIGKVLRKTSLDELPQLFNIIKGDMSLVGPRPLPMREADGCVRWQRQRLDVTPGLTCIWQVKGRSKVTFNEWVRMDVNYIRRQSFLRDVTILAQTVPAVLLRRGAH